MNRTVVRGEILYWIYISYYGTDMNIADIISLPNWSLCQKSLAIILIWIHDSMVVLVLIILLPRENSTSVRNNNYSSQLSFTHLNIHIYLYSRIISNLEVRAFICRVTRRTRTGFIIFLNNASIYWTSKK